MDKTGTPRRHILHVDMDAFFASVEQRDRPALRGRPVVVGGPMRRGVVCSASYEARRYGVKNGQPTAQALRLCPQAVLISSGMGKYREVSRAVHAVLRDHSPRVESVGFDEAYLDVTGVQRLLGPPEWIARSIRRAVRRQTGLPCSVGVA
ncbi:DNA polymerase IV, partial [bacterium]|nr:DNA polymerase IV [bacterium]